MNVSENTNLKGKIKKTEEIPVESPIKKIESNTDNDSFKKELDKLLERDSAEIDPAMVEYSPLSNFIQFDSISKEEFETFNYDTKTIDNTDAMFFLKLSNQADTMNISINDETSVIDASGYKTMEVSKTLGDMLMRAAENNKVLRLDFDEHVTVILKVSTDGKIDASFIPQNKEVENYLKNNIDYLKVRFDEQSIAYSNISYKPYKQPNSKRQNKGDKNE